METIQLLTEDYIPKKILHRKEQIKEIEESFEDLRKGLPMGRALLIQGVSGSGKTVTIKYILKKYSDQYLFASGMTNKTSFKILVELLQEYHKTEDKVLAELINKLQKQKKVIIIDEIHEVKDLDNILENLNAIYRKTNVPIILITNKRMFITKMPEDVKKTLFFIKALFPSYDANQLYDILKERLKEANLKIPKGKMNYICGMGAKQGSARLTLKLSYEYLTKKETNIDKILNNLNKEEWQEIITSLCLSEKNFIKLIVDLSDGNGRKISTSEIQKELGSLSPSRISQIISNLKGYGIIDTEHKNIGRKGGILSYVYFPNNEVRDIMENLLVANEGFII